MRVLIVDDYPDTAEMVSELLSTLGHECRSATRAVDALAAADALEPELVILCVDLPDLGGYDLFRALRARLAQQAPYLVAMTGWPGDCDRSLVAGFDYCLMKPADYRELSRVLELAERWLGAS